MSQAPRVAFRDDELVVFRPRLSILTSIFRFRDNLNQATQKDAECEYCGFQSLKTKPERLIHHAFKCNDIPEDLKEELQDQLELQRESGAQALEVDDIDEVSKRVDALVVDFIAANTLPIAILSSPQRLDIAGLIEKRYKLPKPTRFTTSLLPSRALEIRERAIASLKQAPLRTLTIELDGWSQGSMSLLAVVVTSYVGHSLLLDLVDVGHQSNTAHFLAEQATSVIKASKIELCKFNSIVTDEASNYRLARQIISEKIGGLLNYRCMAHVCNLIGGAIYKGNIRPTLDKLSELVNIVNRSKALESKLASAGANKLIGSVPTRWYSMSNSINSVLKVRDIFATIDRDSASSLGWAGIVDDDDFWSNLEAISVYYNRLSASIAVCEASASLLSTSFRALLDFGRFVIVDCTTQRYSHLAITAFLQHFNKLDLTTLLQAYYLDPNQKISYMTRVAVEETEMSLIEFLLEMGGNDESGRAFKLELVKYKKTIKSLAEPVDVFTWWKNCELPLLKNIGSRFAACHGSSVNTERIFSALGRIFTPDRNRMSVKTAFDLLTIQLALRPNERRLSGQSSQLQSAAESENLSLEATLFNLGIFGADESSDIIDFSEASFNRLFDFNANILDEISSVADDSSPLSNAERAK